MSGCHVLFGGQQLDRRSIGRVFRRGSTVLAEVDGRIQTLGEYSSMADAALAKKYLLFQLGRRSSWI